MNPTPTITTAKRLASKVLTYPRRLRLKETDFSIISNNCWGGYMSQYFGMEYRSPFIGLFLFAPDYIELLQNLEDNLKLELKFIDPSQSKYSEQLLQFGTLGKYPVAKLGEAELHFLHYQDQKEASEKWYRRTLRINFDKLIIKFCDRDLATPELIKAFCELPYRRKVCLTAREFDFPHCLKLANENGEMVENEWENFMLTVKPEDFINRLLVDSNP